jgi:hypothetical protein
MVVLGYVHRRGLAIFGLGSRRRDFFRLGRVLLGLDFSALSGVLIWGVGLLRFPPLFRKGLLAMLSILVRWVLQLLTGVWNPGCAAA